VTQNIYNYFVLLLMASPNGKFQFVVFKSVISLKMFLIFFAKQNVFKIINE
jgi:hypothetical protein